MTRLLRALLLSIFCVSIPLVVEAQSVDGDQPLAKIRPKMPVYSEHVDFSGADLRQIFQTDLDYCESACQSESSCAAITFNFKSDACFLKSTGFTPADYNGAFSAMFVELSQAQLERMKMRAAELDFLPEEQLNKAIDSYYAMPRLSVELKQSENSDDVAAGVLVDEAIAGNVGVAWLELSNLIGSKSYRGERNAISGKGVRRDDLAIFAYLTVDDDWKPEALEYLANAFENDEYDYNAAIKTTRRLNDITGGRYQSKLDDLLSKHGPRVEDSDVKMDGPKPRLCLQFNTKLVENGVNYADYVTTSFDDLAYEVSGAQLCLSGLRNGQQLSVGVRAGMPFANDEVTQKSVKLDFYIPDQPPTVSFAGNGYVLPKGQSATIPITSVNAPTAQIAIYKIPNNNLNAVVTGGNFLAPVRGYETAKLSRTDGVEVWRGEAELKTELNRAVVTALPIQDVIGTFEPGIYVILADANKIDEEEYETVATQWFLISDIGLTSYSGADGFYLVAQSLETNTAAADLRATLYARNNTILGEASTDAQGMARFEGSLLRGTGGNAPSFVAVAGQDDFVFLDLNSAAFDFSDRGVQGRADPGEIDVFSSFDRGIYRPGEVVNTVILARDREAKAISGLPLWAVFERPDGRTYKKVSLSDAGAGGRTYALSLDPGAMRGKWTLKIMAEEDAAPLATNSFQVDDFVPQRIDFTTELPEGLLDPLDPPQISLSASYLFGGVGSDLAFAGTVRREAVTELAQFPGFTFGSPLAEKNVTTLPFGKGMMTDAQGQLSFKLPLPAAAATFQPEVMKLTVALSEGSGLPVERRFERPIRPAQELIGIKPLFDGSVADGDDARFEVTAISRDLTPIDMQNVTWTLKSVDTHYQWYNSDDTWKYKTTKYYETVTTGTIDISTQTTVLEIPLEWGEYELALVAPNSDTVMASIEFDAGWYGAGAALVQSPDKLETGLDKDHFELGDTVNLRLKAPADGVAQIAVMNNKMVSLTRQDVSKGEAEISLKVDESWGAGAYILTSFIQNADQRAGRNPVRAVGVNYAPVTLRDQKLVANLVVPELMMPRQEAVIGLNVDNANGQQVYASLAVVDEGILNLTGYRAPDPAGYYFDQRRLGFEMRDIYGRLIDGYIGETGALRQGGDFNASAPQSFSGPIQEDSLAIFKGPVMLDANGHAEIPVALPEFNGSVKIMAVLWSDQAVGAASTEARVRDPIVILPNMSRFIAPGDEAEFSIDLAHAYGPVGAAEVSVTATDPLDVRFAPTQLSFAEGEKHRIVVPVKGVHTGDASFVVAVKTPSGEKITRTVPISVMRNDNPISVQVQFEIGAGQSVSVPPDLLDGFAPDAQLNVVSALQARLNVGALVQALDRYPYGCSEQLVSRAEPLLAFADFLPDSEEAGKRLQEIIVELAGRQSPNGRFGYWRTGDDADPWLDAYVADFLLRAKQGGAEVPERMLDTALLALSNTVRSAPNFDKGYDYIPYSLYVLAKAGRASVGDLRYYNDVKRGAFDMASSSAQLGVALALYGETERANSALNYALNKASNITDNRSYSSTKSDAAAVRALAIESGLVRPEAMLAEANFSEVPFQGSTQEQAWALRLAHQATENATETFDILKKGKTFSAAEVAKGTSKVENPSVSAQEFLVSITGTPTAEVKANANGYKIRQFLFDINGDRVDAAHIRQNQQVVVVTEVTPETNRFGRLILNDPLPAGLQIENPALLRSGDVGGLPWLKGLSEATHTEFHADRFIAAIDWEGMDKFRFAYVTRATTPGAYRDPAVKLEDMYVPTMTANSKSGTITILSQ